MQAKDSDADYADERGFAGFESAAPIGGIRVRCTDEHEFDGF